MILAVNTSSNALNQLAAELAEVGDLSTYVRPYANLQRPWERRLSRLPRLGETYARSLGRRQMPAPLSSAHITEAGVLLDFAMATHARLPIRGSFYQAIRESFMSSVTNAVAHRGARAFTNERAVVASWSCAEFVFRKAKARGAACVLNYPFAHHRFARRWIEEEAELQPAFANMLGRRTWPDWHERRLDTEIELADRILVGSSFVRDSFVSEGVPDEKLVVVPYGTDTGLFEPPAQKTHSDVQLRLLFVGQISQRKGLSYLLEAARRLKGRGVSLTLVGRIHGDDKALDPYRNLFRYIPHVPRTRLPDIYREADVFVFPTLLEGMPLVVIEAMASGLPVITTAHGSGDIIRDGVDGFLVPTRAVDALVDRIEQLRDEPHLRKEMGGSARRRALGYTWHAFRRKAVAHLHDWLARA